MPAENQTVTMHANSSYLIRLPIKALDGSDLLLAGATITWWMGRGARSVGDDVLLKKVSPAGITVAGSLATVQLVPGDTTALPPGRYYHEARVSWPDGSGYPVTTGPFVLKPALIR